MTDKRFTLTRLPESDWPTVDRKPLCVWLSRVFQVTLWQEKNEQLRLSINRRNYTDGITWDELQRLKAAAGFSNWQAVEFYPPDARVVNKANVRHLWLMHEPLKFAWRSTT